MALIRARRAEALGEGLYRVIVPYEEVTTTVYLVAADAGCAIVDSATYPSDVDGYILPALCEVGIPPETVRCLALTHDHADHAGGITHLSERLPWAAVRTSFAHPLTKGALLREGEILLGMLQTVYLPGHTAQSVGFLDLRKRTLLSGDCLQLAGVGKYRSGILLRDDYVASMERLRTMGIERIVAAHEFDPYGSIAEGRDEVERYLDACIAIARGETI